MSADRSCQARTLPFVQAPAVDELFTARREAAQLLSDVALLRDAGLLQFPFELIYFLPAMAAAAQFAMTFNGHGDSLGKIKMMDGGSRSRWPQRQRVGRPSVALAAGCVNAGPLRYQRALRRLVTAEVQAPANSAPPSPGRLRHQ